MNVLVTGNMGYVGPVLNKVLLQEIPNIKIIGFDSGFFAHSITTTDLNPEHGIACQFFGDVRDIKIEHLKGINAIVHLAGVSNDPMGNEFESVTSEINQNASVRLAKMAIEVGVKHFVFASSCSMYGQADDRPRNENDPTNPLTSYANSKIGTENDIKQLDLGSMIFTSLRFATACGWSPRLRLDLVLNDFIACAITSKNITVLSDGTPWRPLIDVEDMSRAITWAITREASNGGNYLAINAGRDENNHQIKELAETVAQQISGTTVSINKEAPPDKRSYAVDFSLYKNLAPKHLPKVSLEESINQIYKGLISMKFKDENFRNSTYMRLNSLRKHIENGRLSKDLRWKS
jgi:nucleoside-diphosphate-sugar epimerase